MENNTENSTEDPMTWKDWLVIGTVILIGWIIIDPSIGIMTGVMFVFKNPASIVVLIAIWFLFGGTGEEEDEDDEDPNLL